MIETLHILVVDDDAQVRQLIGRLLVEHGYEVTGARDGREMRETLSTRRIDLIVLDLMLPGVSGLDLCRDLRAASSVPIIMLTARGEDTDRIVGLELGADDYLAKPFNPRELLARVRAVLRRAGAKPDQDQPIGGRMIAFAGYRLDTQRREVTSPDGVVIDLSGGEYDLLLAFIERPNRVLSREQLLEMSRHRLADPFDRSIDVQVSRLRRKLEAGEAIAPLIKTIRGAGYLFVPTVKRL
ncbi:response regulator [Defluviicoccus vanus]|uniref:Regulatory protein VirG n=1 Tax=Defluviicoccus vanus TaxID=111831 RepID=A0A7H1N3C9_9PROT|nr:response regulator [Defluviicoccus vanus]QNT70215.1 response regulator [Defluviicoccus vanus]